MKKLGLVGGSKCSIRFILIFYSLIWI